MNKTFLRALTVGALASGVFTAYADDNELFDDRYYVAPMGSLTGNHGDSNYGDGLGGALAIGKSVAPHIGVEILGDYLRYRGKTTTTPTTGLLCGLLVQCPSQVGQLPNRRAYGGGLGVNYYLSSSNAGLFVHANAEGGDRLMYNGGLGFDQPFFSNAVYVRLELLYHKEANYNAEPLLHLGVRLPLGSVHKPVQAAPPPPVAVVPVEEPAPEAAPAPPPPPPCQPPAPGQPISFEGCKTGDTIVLHGVNFDFNKATLTVNAKALLDQVADALLARKDIKVEVDGHTDGKGSVPYNQRLSEARAATVMKYLVARGIEPGRMTSKGFGKSMPIADNSTDEGRELNRRVELKVTESGGAPSPPAEAPSSPAPGGEASTPSPEVSQPASGGATAESVPGATEQPSPSGEKRRNRHHKKVAPEEAPAAPEPAPAAASHATGSTESQGTAEAPAASGPPPASEPPPMEPGQPAQAPAGDSGGQPAAVDKAGAGSDAPAATEPAPAPPDAASVPSDKPQ